MEEIVQVVIYIVIMIVLIVFNVVKGNKKKQEQEGEDPQVGQQPDPWKDIREAMGIPEDKPAPQPQTAAPMAETTEGYRQEAEMELEVPPEVEKMNEYANKYNRTDRMPGEVEDQIEDEIHKSGATAYLTGKKDEESLHIDALDEDFDMRRAVIYSEILTRKYD